MINVDARDVHQTRLHATTRPHQRASTGQRTERHPPTGFPNAYNGRLLSTVPWEPGGVIPPGDPTGGLLRPGVSVTEKFEFIDGEKDNYPLVWMFAWMDISKSGYYEWRGRPDSVTARRRAGLKELIQQIFAEYDETYGYRRIHAELNRRGVPCGPELLRALVRELGLVACQPRPWRLTTIPDADVVNTPDLVKRNFTADDTGAKLVGDITYIVSVRESRGGHADRPPVLRVFTAG